MYFHVRPSFYEKYSFPIPMIRNSSPSENKKPCLIVMDRASVISVVSLFGKRSHQLFQWCRLHCLISCYAQFKKSQDILSIFYRVLRFHARERLILSFQIRSKTQAKTLRMRKEIQGVAQTKKKGLSFYRLTPWFYWWALSGSNRQPTD